MKKIIGLILLAVQLFAVSESEVLKSPYEISGVCQAQCRTVDNKNYRALLRDFNFVLSSKF